MNKDTCPKCDKKRKLYSNKCECGHYFETNRSCLKCNRKALLFSNYCLEHRENDNENHKLF